MPQNSFVSFDWLKYIQILNVPKECLDEFIKDSLEELSFIEQSITDELVDEGYSHIPKKKRKIIVETLSCKMKELDYLLKNSEKKKTIVVRKKKKVSPAMLVKKLLFKESFKEQGLSIVSILPTEIIGSKFLICFNTKNYQIQVYQSEAGETLSVKNSTIKMFCKDLSYSKTIRKNKLGIIQDVQKSTKDTFSIIESINSKRKPLSGRINKDVLLLTCK